MTRSILCGLLALLSVGALGVLPLACQSGGVGDPCTPEEEYQAQFSGFAVEEAPIESRSFQCQTRICLVNHFQGRVSCPQGQGLPKDCTNDSTVCTGNEKCVESQIYAPTCATCNGSDPNCQAMPCTNGLTCTNQVCTCDNLPTGATVIDGVNYVCAPAIAGNANSPMVLHTKVCHVPKNCQTIEDGITTKNKGKDCCVPGTDQPVTVSVCGQCSSASFRNADEAVYCSCRCCAPCCAPGTSQADADNQGCSLDTSTCGPKCDPNANYCTCPGGYTCSDIRRNVGLGGTALAGAYCIKAGTAYTTDATCGNVVGYTSDQSCKGEGTAAAAADAGM